MLLLSIAAFSLTRQAAADTQAPAAPDTIFVDPGVVTATVGNSVWVSFSVGSLANVIGAQISVTFNAGIVNVVDANVGAGGVQIASGTCPTDQVAANNADNVNGDIFYAAANGISNPACGSNFVIAVAEFSCEAAGTSAISYVVSDPLGTVLSDSNGNDITPSGGDVVNGSIVCEAAASTGDLTGTITINARPLGKLGGSGSMITDTMIVLVDSLGITHTALTNANGGFSLTGVNIGPATIETESWGALDARKTFVVPAGPSIVATVALRAGDVTGTNGVGNGIINISDITIVSARIGQACGGGTYVHRADFNRNCAINISDLTVASGANGLSEFLVWP